MVFFVRWVLPFLLAMFPMQTIAELAVVALRRVAKKTDNTFDDELVGVLERRFNIPPTPEVVANAVERTN